MPPFDGIGANEFVVTVTHGVADVISAVDTPYAWELNPWYHTLNVGYRTRISGETDFPCIYGERVGLGRSYVRQPKLDYDDWVVGCATAATMRLTEKVTSSTSVSTTSKWAQARMYN